MGGYSAEKRGDMPPFIADGGMGLVLFRIVFGPCTAKDSGTFRRQIGFEALPMREGCVLPFA